MHIPKPGCQVVPAGHTHSVPFQIRPPVHCGVLLDDELEEPDWPLLDPLDDPLLEEPDDDPLLEPEDEPLHSQVQQPA